MKKDLLILFLLIFPAFALLFQKGYFTMHDDLQSMRQLEMDKCFRDLQIPCRWVPDLGYGYGYPLFNYYPPFPYLLGQFYRTFGFSYIDIVKLIGITGFIATAAFMYLLSREFWGRSGGLISSAFYTYAPYHSVDFWVRGAMNEFWAMCFYPFIFWSTYKLIQTNQKKYISLVSISVSLLMLSHNPMLMIFAPVYLAWIFFWLLKFRSIRSIRNLALSAFWALGLAAFFTLPIIFETKYASVWTLTSGYFNYLAHFVPLSRMFWWVKWGYGASGLGQTDFLSFHIGYLHWITPTFLLISLIFSKKLRGHKFLIILLTLFILAALFMMHQKSTFIWQHFKPLGFLQFPWRFLTIAVFSASLLSGAIVKVLNKKIFSSFLLTLLILINGNYFKPRLWLSDMTDAQKFSGRSWQLLVTSGIFDYLPIYAPFPPADAAGADINITQGNGTYIRIAKTSNLKKYSVNITSKTAVAELQTYYFPGWKY